MTAGGRPTLRLSVRPFQEGKRFHLRRHQNLPPSMISRQTVLWAGVVLLLSGPSRGQIDSSAAHRATAAPRSSFAGTKAGDTREVAGLELRWCPPGRFRMGSAPDETGRRADEARWT